MDGACELSILPTASSPIVPFASVKSPDANLNLVGLWRRLIAPDNYDMGLSRRAAIDWASNLNRTIEAVTNSAAGTKLAGRS
eukprot:6705125-Pyramimonas_sp.AAC.1